MLSGFYRTLPGKFCSDVWGGRGYQVSGAGFGFVGLSAGPAESVPGPPPATIVLGVLHDTRSQAVRRR